ncbi:YesL family protein [Bifidobacterium eulemuris]|uniref:Transferase n=1 Tax=Bifidobacterium eulemuris TaxID=1765219 RepID=A0A261GB05_9BIFI|nr:YesL family protein [Bifidobacterium eulemuris]OZG68590.1 transferase [Bifidobacterium eulemuris]QOL32716.1 YesL family protein [Bifidobacterium eulemuris]
MQIFKQDSPFNEFMSRIGDLAMINVAWIICCLPIVTIGASTGAMYEVTRRLHENDDAHVLRAFLAAFRRRFTVSLALTLIALAFVALASFDLWWLTKGVPDAPYAPVVYGATIAVATVAWAGFGFVFPVMARSTLSAMAQIRQSFRVAVAHPLTTVATLFLNALPWIIAVAVPGGLAFTVFFYGLLLSAVTAYIVVYLMLRAGMITARATEQ